MYIYTKLESMTKSDKIDLLRDVFPEAFFQDWNQLKSKKIKRWVKVNFPFLKEYYSSRYTICRNIHVLDDAWLDFFKFWIIENEKLNNVNREIYNILFEFFKIDYTASGFVIYDLKVEIFRPHATSFRCLYKRKSLLREDLFDSISLLQKPSDYFKEIDDINKSNIIF